jgi:RNA polymerase sigma-70 factor (ECF subfamily)
MSTAQVKGFLIPEASDIRGPWATSRERDRTVPRLDLESIYRAYEERVSRWVSHLAGPSLDVEDVVHDVFLTAERMLPRFVLPTEGVDGQPADPQAALTCWLYRITANVVRSQRRRLRWRRWLFGGGPETGAGVADEERGRERDALGAAVAAEHLRANGTPADELEKKQSTELVYRALDRLPDRYRQVIILFELEEMSGEEIARMLDAKVATVWVWLHRARQRFADEVARLAPEMAAAREEARS